MIECGCIPRTRVIYHCSICGKEIEDKQYLCNRSVDEYVHAHHEGMIETKGTVYQRIRMHYELIQLP